MIRRRIILFVAGFGTGLSFAPLFFFLGVFLISILCADLYFCKTRAEAFISGHFFGSGFFLSSLYWISIGPTVYMEDFWWAIPIGLFGIPLFMALFTAVSSLVSWHFRYNKFYHFIFCVSWVFFEWVTSWIFTGLPWAVMGYALSFSDALIQGASLFSVFGLSFVVVYVGSGFYSVITKQYTIFRVTIVTSIIILLFLYFYGYFRLENNQTTFTDIKVRLVQPSIPQTAKWDPDIFWQNLDRHIELSKKPANPGEHKVDAQNSLVHLKMRNGIIPDIIIWSEAALTAPFNLPPISRALKSVFTHDKQVLILGSISNNNMENEDFKLFSTMLALDSKINKLFEYHKSHLVPFGEYIPFKKFLPFKKLTHGLVDYSPGQRQVVNLKEYNLIIQPMICYESLFPSEVRIKNSTVNVIINVTNDAWYGIFSGPYQHLEIARIRSVENGLPMLRVGNNGISAIIDPLGRIISFIPLNKSDALDGYIPSRINENTKFSINGYVNLFIWVLAVLIIQAKISLILAIATRGWKLLA
jgi:apolipoprotein N-acyltransferase